MGAARGTPSPPSSRPFPSAKSAGESHKFTSLSPVSSSTPSSFGPPRASRLALFRYSFSSPLRFPHSRKAFCGPRPPGARVLESSPALPTGPIPGGLGPPAGRLPPRAAFCRQLGADLPSQPSARDVRPLEPAALRLLPPHSPGGDPQLAGDGLFPLLPLPQLRKPPGLCQTRGRCWALGVGLSSSLQAACVCLKD